jgi:hypothetical protein
MTLPEAVDDVFGQLVDAVLRAPVARANTIEQLWLLFATSMQVPPGGTQWREGRLCFFAGAGLLFEGLRRMAAPDAAERLAAIAVELDRFMRPAPPHGGGP